MAREPLSAEKLEKLNLLLNAFMKEEDDSKAGEIFELFDLDGNGTIESSELQTVLSQVLGERLTSDEVSELILEADTNKNGVIEINEFIEILKQDRDT
jgi:calmodulin